jgi:hypothetical protein
MPFGRYSLLLLNAQFRTSELGKNLVSAMFVAAKCTRA